MNYILVVEDYAPVIGVYVAALKGKGVHYLLASSVKRAKEILELHGLPVAIVMDADVDDGKTFDLVGFIRNELHYGGWMIAASGDEQHSQQLVKLGCDEALNKYPAIVKAIEIAKEAK